MSYVKLITKSLRSKGKSTEGKEREQSYWVNADSQRVKWVHVVNL